MKKFMRPISIALALCCAVSLFGCKDNGEKKGGDGDLPPIPKDVDIWGPYDETVKIKLAVPSSDIKWPGAITGDNSYKDNRWTRAWKEEFNIEADIMWEAMDSTGAYSTRMNLSIVNGDLPDVIVTSDYSQFVKLQEAGKLRALDEYMDAYCYDYAKKNMTYDNSRGLARGKVGDKLYGLPQGGEDSRTREIYIRADWMKELGLAAPKTMDDVIAIGKKFVDSKKAKYALPLYKQMNNGMGDMQAVANSIGAYPFIWVPDDNGGLQYGSVQPQMKQTLNIYADLLKGGYIDRAFSSLDSATLAAQITGGSIGVLPSDYWIISLPLNTMWNDKMQVDWNIYPITPMSTYKTDNMKIQGTTSATRVICVNKDFKHPEALFKIINFATAKLSDPDKAETEIYHSKDIVVGEKTEKYQFFQMSPLYVFYNDPMTNFNANINVTNAIDKKDKSFLKSPEDKVQYNNLNQWFLSLEAGALPSSTSWTMYKMFYGPNSAYGIYNDYLKSGNYIYDALGGYQTETMS
ncbi:MAG: extracellular solute-binding protein, partial [Oscillospiraceae bacterium]